MEPVEEGRVWWRTWFSELSWAAVLAATLITPLYFNPRSARVFEPEKLAWLTVLSFVVLGAGIAWRAAAGRAGLATWRSALRQPLLLAGGFGLLSCALSWGFGDWPRLGFWGSYRRGQGLLACSSFWLIFMAAAALTRRPAARQRLWRLLLAPAPAVAVYALLQRAGIDSLQWSTYGSGSAERAFGSLGNPNFLAAYLAFLAPLALALGLWAWPARRAAGGSPPLLGAALSLLACLVGLAATASRGAVLGAGAGLALCLLIPWALSRAPLAARLLPPAALLLVLALAGLGARGLDGPAWGRGRTVEQRLLVWEASADAMGAADARGWLLGRGLESLPILLGPHLPERLVQLSPEQYFDHAHNRFWDALTMRGLLGLVAEALLPLLGLALCLSRAGGPPFRRLLTAGLAGALLPAAFAFFAGQGHLSLVLAAPAALAAMVGVWARTLGNAGNASSRGAMGRAGALTLSPGVSAAAAGRADGWLLYGSAGLLAAQLVEGAVGLPTVAADLVACLALAALAGRLWAEHGAQKPDQTPTVSPAGGAAAATPRAQLGWDTAAAPLARRAAGSGVIEGLAPAAILLAPLWLPDPALSLAQPALFLIPVACLVSLFLLGGHPGDRLAALPGASPRRRAEARGEEGPAGHGWRAAGWGLAPLLALGALTLADARPGAESLAWGLALLGCVTLSALLETGGPLTARPRAGAGAWLLLPLLLLLSRLTWLWAAAPLLADRHLRLGQEAAARQDLTTAAAELARARELWPDQPTLLWLQARIAGLRMEEAAASSADLEAQFSLARETLTQALSIAPLDSLLDSLAGLYRSRGDLALPATGAAGEGPPGEEARHWWAEALSHYEAFQERYPLSPAAWSGLAGTQERLGQAADARQAYDQAWLLNAGDAGAAAGSLRTALATGAWVEALATLEQALGPQGVDRAAFLAAAQDDRGLPPDAPGLQAASVMALALGGAREEAGDRLSALSARPGDAAPLLPLLRAWLAEQ